MGLFRVFRRSHLILLLGLFRHNLNTRSLFLQIPSKGAAAPKPASSGCACEPGQNWVKPTLVSKSMRGTNTPLFFFQFVSPRIVCVCVLNNSLQKNIAQKQTHKQHMAALDADQSIRHRERGGCHLRVRQLSLNSNS